MRKVEVRNQQGVALITVITALVALMVIAVPFLIAMRLSFERSEANRARVRAMREADSLMRFLEVFLVRTTDRIEKQEREAQRGSINNDPERDTQTEIEPSLEQVATALGVRAEDVQDPYGTILGWRVDDENAKLNLNSASYFALGNLLGLGTLAEEIGEQDTSVILADASRFPSRGYVLLDREVISYESRSGNRLQNCRRGLNASR
ncbi:MAG: hypothetical protein ACE5JG_08100, partial [Planctomycetota bacterium]